MKFSDLSLIPQILKAAAQAGYETPSPIQQKAIPPVLEGRDLLGCAQTGTGKTAAFAMPILQRLSATPAPAGKRPIRALILTPTRELALQIDESFADYGRYLPLRCSVIFGGVNQNPQVAQLQRGIDVLTATPGRLNDLVAQGYIDLSHVEIFVLDEADRMLDMGFVHDVKRVIAQLPAQKQTLLFSATMPREIEELASGLLHQPVKVMVTPPSTTVEKIEQSVYFVDKGNKRYLLAHLLENPAVQSALVFTRTKHGADRVVRELGRAGVQAMAIHGNKSQNARQDALARFKDGRLRVLVATDIAARGIDVSGLTHVFNYDLPNIPETYVHRIGRTGRAGRPGIAVSFCDFEEKAYLADIEALARIKIPVHPHAWPMQVMEIPEKKTVQRAPREASAQHSRRGQSPAKTVKSEEPAMEEQKAKPQNVAQAEGAEGDSPAKRRRRRGGRRHGKNGTGAPEMAAQATETPTPQPKAQKPAAKQQAKPPVAPKQPAAQKPVAPQKNNAPQKPAVPQKPAPQQQKPAAQQEQKARPAKPVTKPAAKSASAESDNSLQVISRKAPVQKFASFADYMKARGTDEEE